MRRRGPWWRLHAHGAVTGVGEISGRAARAAVLVTTACDRLLHRRMRWIKETDVRQLGLEGGGGGGYSRTREP